MTEHVLIIDDEENIRQMIRLTLEASGYGVEEAADGLEAFAILGGETEWDVILLDQRLPVMEGTDVLRRLKVLAPLAKVIMMTAFASVELAVEAMRLGATDFLRKPMTPEIVRNAVSAAASSRSERQLSATMSGAPLETAETVTMNGFRVLSAINDAATLSERRFLVRTPAGEQREIVVEISRAAFEEVELVAPGRLDQNFWTNQAQEFLVDFIWNDGHLPVSGKLVLKGAERDALEKLALEARG